LYIVEKLLGKCKINGKRHFKVKWEGYSRTTWELEENLPHELVQQYLIKQDSKKRKVKKD
jgi:hypothetical protein